jgi:hypothetical protein
MRLRSGTGKAAAGHNVFQSRTKRRSLISQIRSLMVCGGAEEPTTLKIKNNKSAAFARYPLGCPETCTREEHRESPRPQQSVTSLAQGPESKHAGLAVKRSPKRAAQ